MKFHIHGHANVTGTHKTTFEFTKDSDLTKNGDCILGVRSDFEIKEVTELLSNEKISIRISAGDISDEITADVNKDFSDSHEIVFRITDFCSPRTLGIRSSKAAKDINPKIIDKLKDSKFVATVEIRGIE
jgi:uncharacterized protein